MTLRIVPRPALFAATLMLLAGCSTTPQTKVIAANGKTLEPPPRVQECAVTNSGSPAKYVCNGKQYTSFDLARMRNEYEAQLQNAK